MMTSLIERSGRWGIRLSVCLTHRELCAGERNALTLQLFRAHMYRLAADLQFTLAANGLTVLMSGTSFAQNFDVEVGCDDDFPIVREAFERHLAQCLDTCKVSR